MDDTDEQTFVRFCEYAYTGDYTPAQSEFPLASKNATTLFSTVDDEECFRSSSSKKKKKKGKSSFAFDGLDEPDESVEAIEPYCGRCNNRKEQILWDEFQIRDYSVISPRFRPRENFEECKSNTSPFLYHARIYVFADKYDITTLRNLALDKLHQTLRSFKAAGIQTESLVDLIRFSYSNDNTRDNEAGQDVDGLRKMVVHFVACVFENVVKDENFLALMEDGGPLPRDLVGLLAKRITC